MNIVKEKDLSFYKDLGEMCRGFGERLRKWINANHDFGTGRDFNLFVLPFLVPGILSSFMSGLKNEK